MRIRPRVLLAKYLVSSTVQFLDVRWGIRVFIIYFLGMTQTGMIQNGYDSKRVWFKTHMIQNEYDSISLHRIIILGAAHGASYEEAIPLSLQLWRKIHGVGSNGMWWTYWVSKGAMDSVHMSTRAPQTLRIHRIIILGARRLVRDHITFIMMIGMMLTYGHTI